MRRARWPHWSPRCAHGGSKPRRSGSHSPNGFNCDEIADCRLQIVNWRFVVLSANLQYNLQSEIYNLKFREPHMSLDRSTLIPALKNMAAQLRIDSIRSTSEAGSGHPTSCASAADLVAALFFAEMRFDPQNPRHPGSDRFVLSKGHAAPILYAAWAEAGAFDRAELLKLRRIDSDLEGHPTPRLSFVDVATGSLGQGICAAIGIALNARRIKSDYRTYVLIGDGESAEGSVWEAADVAAIDKLDNLCGITDVNGLGQSRPTMWEHDMEQFARRWRAFGWHAIVIDGHDMGAILDALDQARRTKGQP